MAAGAIPSPGHLPGPGGVGDQSAWLLDAFDVISAAFHELRPPEG